MSLELKVEDIGDVEDYVVKASTNKCFMVINNFENDPIPDRRLIGYNVDAKKLEETLEHFNFEVTVEKNLPKNKMVKAIKNFVMESEFDEDDCVLCCIFTHGLEHGGLYGTDEKSISVEAIIDYFTNNVPTLAGKPKLFLIQACRGKLYADTVPTSVKTASGARRVEQSDVFVFYSTFEGYVAFVDDNHGSFFIQALCKVLQKYGGKHSLQKIGTKVNDILSTYVAPDGKCQSSEMRSSLTREVYLQTNGPMADGTYPIYEDKTKEVITRASIPSTESSPETNSVAGDPVLKGTGNPEEQPSSDTSPSDTNVNNSSNDQTGQSSKGVDGGQPQPPTVGNVINNAVNFLPNSFLNADAGQMLNNAVLFAQGQKDAALSASWVDID